MDRQPPNTTYRRGKDRRAAASKMPFSIIVDGSTDTAVLSQPAIVTTIPSAAIGTEDFGVCRLRFGGTDAENETIDYQVVLWTKFETPTGAAYVPLIAAKGTATLGILTYGAGTAIGAAGNLFADTITDTLGHRGSYITSPAGDSIAELEIDLRNAEAIEVQIDLGTAASADVLLQFGEMGGSFNDVEIASTGLATSALQTSLNTLLAVGTGVMTSAQAVTIATDDTQLGTVGANADPDGNVHGQLRSIAENTVPQVTLGGGSYIRQDATDTMAMETGGNLAAIAADLNELTSAPVEKALTRLVPVAIAVPGTPIVLIGAETFATKLIVQAGKILGVNAGLISIGTNIAYTTDLQIQLPPGDTYVVEARPGCKFDIADIYIDGVNAADGVRGQYMPA